MRVGSFRAYRHYSLPSTFKIAIGTSGPPAAALWKPKQIRAEGIAMYLSGASVVVIYLVGIAAGLLAGQVKNGTGFGFFGDPLIGIIGAFIGGGLMPQLGLDLGAGVIGAITNATIGAVVLLFVCRIVRGRSRPDSDWANGWRRVWR